MNTNDNCGLVIFKWLVTIMSLGIALPAMFDNTAKITFILTSCVFIFSKFVDNIEGISKYKTYFQTAFCIIGSAVGAVAIGFCFYYFAAIFNETMLMPAVNAESELEIENAVTDSQNFSNVEIKTPSFDKDMSKYPFFGSFTLYTFLFIVLMFYLLEETIFGGCELCKYFNTKKKLIARGNRIPKILNI